MAEIEWIAVKTTQMLLNTNTACDQGASCGAGALQSTASLWGSLHWGAAPALASSLLCAASEYLEDELFEAFSLTALQCQLYLVWTTQYMHTILL